MANLITITFADPSDRGDLQCSQSLRICATNQQHALNHGPLFRPCSCVRDSPPVEYESPLSQTPLQRKCMKFCGFFNKCLF